jgi:hypothetical protein
MDLYDHSELFACGASEMTLDTGTLFRGAERSTEELDEIDTGTVLGLAMAREIGHVLLRSVGHSQAGIMKSPWTKADIQHAAARLSEFTALESRAKRQHACAYAANRRQDDFSCVLREGVARSAWCVRL